jgi:plasmid maintenance system antidote protein VapI
MSTKKKKIEKFLSFPEKSGWTEKAHWRAENRGWLSKSGVLAANVLQTLREMNLSQKELANRLKVSPQHINAILKGSENLTLETIDKLENALGISLITMIKFDQRIETVTKPNTKAAQTKVGIERKVAIASGITTLHSSDCMPKRGNRKQETKKIYEISIFGKAGFLDKTNNKISKKKDTSKESPRLNPKS